jgi:acyl-CoA synthetase (AMP-forming)/AMP-acid ligase II
MYTAGSSGKPKAVIHHHGQLRVRGAYLADLFALSPADTVAAVSPMFHVSGQSMWLAALSGGARLATMERWDPHAFLELARERQVTLVHLISTLLAETTEAARPVPSPAVPTLRVVMTGGSFVDRETLVEFEAAVGGRPVQGYGRTEGTVTWESPFADPPYSSHGEIRPDVSQVRIVHSANGSLVDSLPGEIGEMLIAGDGVSRGYWRNEQATDETYTEDGWLRSGDLGYIDGDNRLHFVGRADDMVKTGGENVYPSSVEQSLSSIEGVREVSVAASPSAQWGQMVSAVLVVRSGTNKTNLIREARTVLAAFELPRRWVFVTEIPRLPSHKVDRLAVARLCGMTAAADPSIEEIINLD